MSHPTEERTCATSACDLEVVATEVVPLCDEHLSLMTLWMVPRVYAQYPASRWHKAADRYAEAFGPGPIPMTGPPRPSTARLPHLTEARSVVYFIQAGSRVKIGTTTQLKGRIASLTLSDAASVVLTLKGGRPLEQQLHTRFRDQRIGKSEWFELEGGLAEYIKAAG